MKQNKKLSIRLREWHRDLGYLVIGITIIYSLSGIVLSFRDLHLFEKKYILNAKIEKNLPKEQLKDKIISVYKQNEQKKILPAHIIKKSVLDNFQEVEESSKFIKYQVSRKKDMKLVTYYKDSGEVIYSINGYPTFIQIFVNSHKSSTQDRWSYLALAYSVILFFLAISAIFIVKGKYSFKQRGVYLTLAGIGVILLFLYI